MRYTTLTQRVSDFFPANLKSSEANYFNQPFPSDVYASATRQMGNGGYGYSSYNSVDGLAINYFEGFSYSQKGAYLQYVQMLDNIYYGSTYRYNVVLGYNNIRNILGNYNIYLGTNSSPNSLTTSNTISIGHNIVPIENYIILKPNINKGQIYIIPPRNVSEICIINIFGNNYITYASTTQNISSCNINLSGSYFNVYNTKQNISSCNINLSGSYFNVFNTSQNISSCNINLSGSYFNIYNTSQNISSCNINLSGSYFNVYNTKQNISSCNINLSGSYFNIFNTSENVSSCNINLSGSYFNVYNTKQNISSCNINLSGSYFNIFNTSENVSSCNINLSGSYFNVFNTSQNISSCNINLSGSYFNVFNTSENVSSCNITLTGNEIYSKTLSANIDNSDFRITSTSQELSSSDIYLSNSTFSASNCDLLFNNMNLKFERKTTALGISALSDRNGMFSYSTNGFSNIGDAQKSNFIFIGTTSDNSLNEIFCDSGNGRMTIPTNKVWNGIVNVVGCDSSGIYCSRFCRQVTIGNRNGTTALYGTVATIGTDLIASVGGSQASSEVVITANSTYDALTIQVRGYSGYTFRWIVSVDGVEMKFV